MIDVILQGDCLERLKELEDNSVDLICTDPPYGYSFMGKDWDKAVPSVEVWKECLRVLKSGAFMFVMSAPRQDVLSQMIVRIGEAGFNTSFTSLYWTYASGFPKAMNIGKMVDKRNGVQGEVIGTGKAGAGMNKVKGFGVNTTKGGEATTEWDIRKVESELDGSYGGFQPKPAVEVIIVAMKPLSEKTYVDQALNNGKGITWLDDARIPTVDSVSATRGKLKEGWGFDGHLQNIELDNRGRFPANLLVSDDVLNDGVERVSSGGYTENVPESAGVYGKYGTKGTIKPKDSGSYSRYFSLDSWAQNLPFLQVAKASKCEKNRGLGNLPTKERPLGISQWENQTNGSGEVMGPSKTQANSHPTVKPLKLMSYLITLGSRENDTVLDPFAGSCTTLVAAKELKRNYVGIEREKEYVAICEARLDAVLLTLF